MNTIRIFTTETCPHCQQVKDYLTRKGFDFIECNVQKEKEARQELIKKGYRGVPIIEINGTDVIGFDKEKLDKLLKI